MKTELSQTAYIAGIDTGLFNEQELKVMRAIEYEWMNRQQIMTATGIKKETTVLGRLSALQDRGFVQYKREWGIAWYTAERDPEEQEKLKAQRLEQKLINWKKTGEKYGWL